MLFVTKLVMRHVVFCAPVGIWDGGGEYHQHVHIRGSMLHSGPGLPADTLLIYRPAEGEELYIVRLRKERRWKYCWLKRKCVILAFSQKKLFHNYAKLLLKTNTNHANFWDYIPIKFREKSNFVPILHKYTKNTKKSQNFKGNARENE